MELKSSYRQVRWISKLSSTTIGAGPGSVIFVDNYVFNNVPSNKILIYNFGFHARLLISATNEEINVTSISRVNVGSGLKINVENNQGGFMVIDGNLPALNLNPPMYSLLVGSLNNELGFSIRFFADQVVSVYPSYVRNAADQLFVEAWASVNFPEF